MTDLFSGDLDRRQSTPSSRRERREQRQRRSQRRKNILTFLVMIVALVLLIGGAWFFIKPMLAPSPAEVTDYPGPGSGSVEIVIAEGDSGTAIGGTLVDAGVVKTVQAFTQAYNANPNATSIQSGTYSLPEEMRAADAVAALLDPAYRADLRITIPEGWTAAQVNERIASNLDVKLEEVESAAAAVGESLPAEAEGNLEGWIAPSTYTIPPESTVEDVLTQMVDLTESTLSRLEVPEEDQQEVIIKASIVEREVPEEYRAQVARVIENRLEGCSGDKALGVDATLVYAFGKQYSEIPVKERDESPYNTRKNPGLPPTPIGSPSVNAIEAVLNPAEGDWCYFVTVNLETQETLFTDDVNEHIQNQQKYREYLNKIRSEANDEE